VAGLTPSVFQFFVEQEHYTAGPSNAVLFGPYVVGIHPQLYAPYNHVTGYFQMVLLFPEHDQV
jgi:hypothetical protein